MTPRNHKIRRKTISTIKSSKPEKQKQIKVKGKPDLNSTVIEKKIMSKQEIDKDKTLVLDQVDDIDSGIPQTTFASSHATITTKSNKTPPMSRKKKIQLQTKVVKKSKHTLNRHIGQTVRH